MDPSEIPDLSLT